MYALAAQEGKALEGNYRDALLRLAHDESEIDIAPGGCDLIRDSVGSVVALLAKDPEMFSGALAGK